MKSRRLIKMASFAMLGLVLSPFVQAEGNAKRGEAKARSCVACHGIDGIATIDSYPSLRGQNEGYLIISMNAYKENKRSGGLAGMMRSQVARLSDQDIADIAAYYANMGKIEN